MEKKEKGFLREHWLIISIIFVFFFWMIYSYSSKGIFYSLTNSETGSIINFINSFGFFSWIVFMLLVILEVVLAPIPPLVLYITGGFLFGALFGGILTLIGNLIGAAIDFFIARKYGRNFVAKKMNRNLKKKFDRFSKKHGGFSIFFLRINPFTSSDLFSYLAGLSKIKFGSFILGTFFGLIPMIFLQTYFGGIFAKENNLISVIIIILSILYLIVFVYLIIKTLIKKSPENYFFSKASKTLESGLNK